MERYFKIFFSKNKESLWLNKMGSEGYFLEKIDFHKYQFSRYKNSTFCYSIEHLNSPLKSDEADEYYNTRNQKGEKLLFRKGKWDYYCSTGKKINITAEAKKKISDMYFWKTLYLFFFSLTGTLACGYQVFALKFLEFFGHKGDGQFDMLPLEGSKFLIAIKNLWNGILNVMNNTYLKLFTNIFGDNSVALVMAFLLPITIVLITLFSLNLDEYIFWKYTKNISYGTKTSKIAKRK